jgi:polysaccharide biosynthesis/export protein
MFQLRTLFCLVALAVTLAGCSAAAVTPEPSYLGASRGSFGPYVLGPGDRLRIKSYGDEDVSGEYEIGSSGNISIPLVGEIRAAGTTTTRLEETIASRMKGSIATNPKINVEIAAYAPFFVLGEVKKAGEYSFHPGLTVADAIAMAGGLTYRANENGVVVRHAGSSIDQVIAADEPIRVSPGDNIRVTERIF